MASISTINAGDIAGRMAARLAQAPNLQQKVQAAERIARFHEDGHARRFVVDVRAHLQRFSDARGQTVDILV